MPLTIELDPHPTDAHREAILGVLVEANLKAAAPANWQPLALLLRDEHGAITGGLWGESLYDWLFIELLAVPSDARGTGLGTQLMQQAESEARRRGLIGVWLDTFHFQARPFYEKLGYTVFGTLPDHPRGGARFFLQKRL